MDTAEIHEIIGGLLAQGHTDDDIIDSLVDSYDNISFDEACVALRKVYDGWQHTREALDLNDGSVKDWHVFLRKRILQKALSESTTASLRLALSVLDSLAAIQGVSVSQGQVMPLSITLVEKAEEPEDETDTESADASGHD